MHTLLGGQSTRPLS